MISTANIDMWIRDVAMEQNTAVKSVSGGNELHEWDMWSDKMGW